MIKFNLCVCIICFAQASTQAEILKVFLATERRVSISEHALSHPINGKGELMLNFYSPGKQIGLANLPITLDKIHSVARAENTTDEPFFGEGIYLLLVDERGKTYIAIFEHESKERVTMRIGLGALVKLDEKGEVQIGYPYESSTTYKKFIEEIRNCLIKWKKTEAVGENK